MVQDISKKVKIIFDMMTTIVGTLLESQNKVNLYRVVAFVDGKIYFMIKKCIVRSLNTYQYQNCLGQTIFQTDF